MKSEVVPEKDFATAVADELVTAINEVLDEREKCAISLSGGTTPAAVYRLLGLPPRVREVDW
ncbi:MAG: 6-phosphogluconolactonase, partial [Bdellovibrionales bacterium]|nr:6-phosphogluconolactonase [Bdellovibrionales bacterium]